MAGFIHTVGSSGAVPQGVRNPISLPKLTLCTLVITTLLLAGGAVYAADRFAGQDEFWIVASVRIITSVILALVPLLISHVQVSAREKQLAKLKNLDGYPASRTLYFSTAYKHVGGLQPAWLDAKYGLPMATLSSVLVIGFLLISLGSLTPELLTQPSFLLGGTRVVGLSTPTLPEYQTITFAAIAVAFFAGYIYTVSRLIDRVNNNDLYPITFYKYAARIVIACVVAAVLRHALVTFSIESSTFIILLAFAIGFAPDLFITVMLRKAFQTMKIGSQSDPDEKYLPTTLNLLMLEGMTREKIDRLSELGIDSAFVMATRNPFVIWTRVPYDLIPIVDWIAQAQLYKLSKEEGVSALRRIHINNIFDLYENLQDMRSRGDTSAALGLKPEAVSAYLSSLEKDPSFARLREVRQALLPQIEPAPQAESEEPHPDVQIPRQAAE